jgi:dihydroorotate dehydrogenase
VVPEYPRQRTAIGTHPIYTALRNILFHFDAERSHRLGMGALSVLQSLPPLLHVAARRNTIRDERLRQSLFGSTFENPIGLAAGFDKNASVVRAWAALGFGFVEVGTVTPKPQPGNDRPRLFRIPEEASLQNAMGFNNDGMNALQRRLSRMPPLPFPLGVNLGKNKSTPLEEAEEDYAKLIPVLHDCCDYFVINLSSPNTPGLRDLENPESIHALFHRAAGLTDKPVLLKVSPDLEPDYTVELCRTAVDAGAAGIIATNTSIDYTMTPHAQDFGGLSGQIIREKSYTVFRAIAEELFGETILISVGGIDSGAEAYRRLRAGASLVQIYTALVYHGPGLVRSMNTELLELMQQDGAKSLSEVIGADL